MKPKRKKNGSKNPKQTTTKAANFPDAPDGMTRAKACHQSGNRAFGLQQYDEAWQEYTNGIQILQSSPLNVEENNDIELRKLWVVLHGNRALVQLQRQEYAAAECDCSTILQEDTSRENDDDDGIRWKLWYRRALAREHLAQQRLLGSKPESPEQPTAEWYIAQAQQDLECCQKCLEKMQQPEALHTAELEELPVVLERLNHLRQQCSSLSVTTVPPPPPPALSEQREDVIRLLEARDRFYPGEAYFLLDWIWWSEWCQHVQLFSDDPGNTPSEPSPAEDAKDESMVEDDVTKDTTPVIAPNMSLEERILQRLPPGARRPDPVDDEEDQPLGPGPIDNASLLLPHPKDWKASTQTVFYKHWYRPYYHPPAPDALDDFLPLKPGLVRGYHYEIIPREVYNALRTWYSELTPSICRRATVAEDASLHVVLYPLDTAMNAPSGGGECSACGAVGVTMRCVSCRQVCYCDRTCQETDWKRHKPECAQFKASSNAAVASSSRAGRTGLNNLGNTCFMNSAIQCLAHATPLTRHFRSGQYQVDVNDANPLGTGGQLAHAYAEVMKALHLKSQRTCSPTQLKRAIAMFAPRFAGYLQHDAQEFLAYLLDGLHEDLNRIRKAPYVEMPDVTDGQCIAVAGARAWDAHHRRNDSLVLDTFYGQFKSTCVCPKCQRVSVSFDAYNHVSLEIPQEIRTIIPVVVIVYPSPTKEHPFPQPTRYSVSMRSSDLISDIKDAVSALCGIPMSRIQLCEIQKNTIAAIHHDANLLTQTPLNRIMAYDVHPMGADVENVFHIIATHRIMADTMPNGELVFEPFGVPIMTSFETTYTCREVWNHLWSMVSFCVLENLGDNDEDNQNGSDTQNMLQIRLVSQQNGKPLQVFPISNGNSRVMALDEESTETVELKSPFTSLLPRDCDETLLSFMGQDALPNFLFFHLEWTDSVDPTPEPHDGEEGPVNMLRIDEERFLAVQNHYSYIEAVKSAKSKEGQSKKVTLDQCFDTFTKPERLDEHNMWYCSSCKDHVQALKTMELWKLPNVLIVHLKRFEFKHALRRDKLDTLVDFPLSGLDMNAHLATVGDKRSCVDDRVPAIYDCFAVVNHFGRMGFGHYTAYARPWNEAGITNDWALFDDSSVRSVEKDRAVVSSAAYVLLYRRRIFS